MSEPVIRMEKIVKTYYVGKPNELEILHGIDLTVNQGEFVSIVGESGSGKSTLMNIIGVLDRQTSGSYYLEGQDVNGMTDEVRSAVRNRRIGFVFQNFNLLPRANALKNVMVPLIYGEEKTKNAKERAMEMLAMVGMDGRADHRPNELSGGQKQRYYFGENYAEEPVVNSPFSILYGWTVCLAVLGGMKRWGNRTSRKTAWLSKKSYGLYLFHYLALSAAAYFLDRYTKVTGVAAYLLSGIAAYAGGYLLYELIKRIPVIRWCVIGEKKERKHVQR